jgi:hypothetical protein
LCKCERNTDGASPVPCIIEVGREEQVYWKGMEESNTAGVVNLSRPLSHELVV